MQQDPYKVINYDQYDFEQSVIIKPKTQNFDDTHRIPTKTAHVIVNSTDRNIDSYPTPSDYIAYLCEEIQDVTSCELKVALLPHNPYNITKANNSITVNGATVILAPGLYEGQSLATRLTNEARSEAGVDPTITITFDDITKHFVFTCDSAFSLSLGTSSIGTSNNKGSLLKVLGFPTQSPSVTVPIPIVSTLNIVTGKHELESTYAADLTANNTIIMNIDTMYVKSSMNNVFNRAYGVIPQKMVDYTIGDVYSIKKVFNPPVPRIDKLRIRFYDIYGNPYDFQNQDHVLEFAFESHKNIRKYQAYTS